MQRTAWRISKLMKHFSSIYVLLKASSFRIYYRKNALGVVISAVHIDAFLSVADPPSENTAFKAQMKEIWTISEARFCVRIAISHDKEAQTVFLSQTALIDRIITQFGQQDAYPIKTPMDPGLKLRRPNPSDVTTTRPNSPNTLIDPLSAVYLSTASRPEITYAVQRLSQFLDSYSYAHWNAAICVIQHWYLKCTHDFELVLGGSNPINLRLMGFTDLDWANCLDTRRSVGYSFTLSSGIVSWKQKTVTSSLCEAEYTTTYECSKEEIWLWTLLSGIWFAPPGPTPILCDNNAAINLSEYSSLHQRVNHIDIKYHFLHERVCSLWGTEIVLRQYPHWPATSSPKLLGPQN